MLDVVNSEAVYGFRGKGKPFCFTLILLILFLFTYKHSYAEDISFELLADTQYLEVGESTMLGLKIVGTRNASAPALPNIDGFSGRYIGPSTQMSIVNGVASVSITHKYTLVALKEGKFTIGPFTLNIDGKQYTSNAITIAVTHDKKGTAQNQPNTARSGGSELKNRIFMSVIPEKNVIYINEKVPLKVKLFIKRLSVKDIEYPKLAGDWLSVMDYEKPQQKTEYLNGETYDTIEFTTRFFATKTGDFVLGPALLKCNIVVPNRRSPFPGSPFDDDFFDSFFNSYATQPLEINSNEVKITVLPVPDDGKPVDFRGAIGHFNFSLEAEPKEVKVGDPITVKMIISGEGNLTTIKAPVFSNVDNFKVYDPEVKVEQATVTFKQALIPKNASVKEVPAASFSFFEPESKTYKTIVQGPIPINVTGSEKDSTAEITDMGVKEPKSAPKETLGKDLLYIKETRGKVTKKANYLYQKPAIFFIILIPLILYVVLLIIEKKLEKLRTDIRYARRLKAPKKAREGLKRAKEYLKLNDSSKFYSEIFITIKEYLGNKLHLPPGSITFDTVTGASRIDEAKLNNLKEILDACDIARYAQTTDNLQAMERVFSLTEEFIDYMERCKTMPLS
ncbi:MAG: BatD family protein [Candidatus Magnetoovum sp. WYHC-5]|nr:BatD family protein [Candidatus Magnetoovum sp. WYHC-5]